LSKDEFQESRIILPWQEVYLSAIADGEVTLT
jgi:hypothetical protein